MTSDNTSGDNTAQAVARPGLVYTFYSYKGGVGRSMALVNVGVLMALDGHKVLLIDWDLEAPGLDTFFLKSAVTDVIGNSDEIPGIIDLLQAQSENRTLSWRDCLLKIKFKQTSLDLISAGRRSDDYRSRLQQLDWAALFKEHNIGNVLDGLRNEWRSAYDFVLVDSRTGITDIGDVCTVLLPDAIVAMFVANHQNVEGVKVSVQRALKARSKLPVDRSQLMIIPVHGRDESKTEYDLSVHWQDIFERELNSYFKDWLPKEIETYEALSMACTRFRRHRVRCFIGTGGGSWRGGSLRGSLSLRLCG